MYWLRKEKSILFFTVLIISLFFVNRYIYRNRDNGYMFTDAVNYNQFYFVKESPHIKGFDNLSGDSLRLQIDPVPEKPQWKIKNNTGSYNYTGLLPVIKLSEGVHTYHIYSEEKNGLDSVELRIEHIAADEYTFVEYCTLPILEFELFPVQRWTQLPGRISDEEINEVKRIIKDEIKINGNEKTADKIALLGTFLFKHLRPQEGGASGEMKELTPLNQFRRACENKDKVDCAIYSDIYFLFANCAGIPTRRIGVMGRVNQVTTSGHVFNESYIYEQSKWAFVDLTSKKLMVLNRNKTALNTIDLLNLNRMSVYGKAATVTVDSLNIPDIVGYEKTNLSEVVYLKPAVTIYAINADINNNMNFTESFTEFLGERSHYGTYYSNTIHINNSGHYLKLNIFQTSLCLFFLWLIVINIKMMRCFKKTFSLQGKSAPHRK